MLFGEGPHIKNIAGDLNKLFLQGSRVGQSITNVEGDAAADQGTTALLANMDPVIRNVAMINVGGFDKVTTIDSLLLSIGGSVIVETEFPAKVNSLDVSYTPFQLGSGEASVDNVRHILAAVGAYIKIDGVAALTVNFNARVFRGVFNPILGTLTNSDGMYRFTGNETWSRQAPNWQKYYTIAPNNGYLILDGVLPVNNNFSVPITTAIGNFNYPYNNLQDYPNSMCIATDRRIGINDLFIPGGETLKGIELCYELVIHQSLTIDQQELIIPAGNHIITAELIPESVI